MSDKKRVCIIGAGHAGLCAAKHTLENDMQPMVFERKSGIGGLWIGGEEKENDEFNEELGINLIYEGLRTNVAKEAMGFYDFSYRSESESEESFVGPSKVIEFLQDYVDHFQLMPHINLQYLVIRVRPCNGAWEVIVKDIKLNKYETHYFDYVLLCNGHYSSPAYPVIKGMDIFKGTQLHTCKYRNAEAYKDKVVLTIGKGLSAMDICPLVAQLAKTVLFSHHAKNLPIFSTVLNVTYKPDVKEFTEDGAIFQDDTTAKFDCVIYCTGYKTVFPFLSVDCGIHVEDNFVQPLYKHCINITHPTMAIIGLPSATVPSQVIDLQLRFVFKYYTGQLDLPSRTEMLTDTEEKMAARWANGVKKRKAHAMGPLLVEYVQDLVDTAGVTNIRPVQIKLFVDSVKELFNPQFDYAKYRKQRYRIIDDENYEIY